MIRLLVPVCSLAFALLAGTMHCAPTARINVRDYGAKGDGFADDAPAIQKAIEAARGKGPGTVVTIPAGRYRLNRVNLAAGGTIVTADSPRAIQFAVRYQF